MKHRRLIFVLLLIILLSSFAPAFYRAEAASKTDIMNSAKLTPLRTGYDELDTLVDGVFGKIITNNMTTYQKVKACYDYIIKESHEGPYANDLLADIIVYNEGYVSLRDAYIVHWAKHFFTKYSGVGDEYASAFVVLTRAIGLESYLITGETATSSGENVPHKWAAILINGTFYTFDPKSEYNTTARRGDGKIVYGRFFMTDKDTEGRLFCADRDSDTAAFNDFKKYGFFRISAEANRKGKIRTGTDLEFRVSYEGQAETCYFAGLYINEGAGDYFNTDKAEKLKNVSGDGDIIKWTADRAGIFTLCIMYKDGRERTSRFFISYEIKKKNDLKTDGAYASGISAGTVFTELDLSEGDAFYDAKGDALTEKDLIGTGDTFVSDGVSYKVYVKGDTDGDGKLTVTDYLLIKRHILKTTVLTEEFFKAADVDGDGSVASTDYVLIKRHLLNISDIYC